MQEDTRNHPSFDRFVQTIATLRAPDGCPWDREQTHRSIAQNMLEEAYEAVAAIEEDDIEHLREELGDVLLQVVLQAQIATEAGEFTIDDIIEDIDAKMLRRHPHVFGMQKALAAAGLDPSGIETGADVLPLWDLIKAHEKKLKEEERAKKRRAAGLDPDAPAGQLDDVPRTQPALMQAQEVSRKTARLGFEWDTTDDVWDKFDEEVVEFKEALSGSAEAELEMGDMLFCLVNVARKEGIDAETALRRTCEKFRRRWSAMEESTREQGIGITDCGTEQLEDLWQEAKRSQG